MGRADAQEARSGVRYGTHPCFGRLPPVPCHSCRELLGHLRDRVHGSWCFWCCVWGSIRRDRIQPWGSTMNDTEYKAFVQSAYQGRLLVGVDRVFARKLYTDVATAAIEKATGEAPYLEKLVVWFAFLASPFAILSSAVLGVVGFRWWAFLVLPVAFLWWMGNRGDSVRRDSSMWLLTLAVIASVVVHFTGLLPNQWMSGFVAVFAFAMWCDRLLYCSSTVFLRCFVLRNPRALEAFGEGITVRDVP